MGRVGVRWVEGGGGLQLNERNRLTQVAVFREVMMSTGTHGWPVYSTTSPRLPYSDSGTNIRPQSPI